MHPKLIISGAIAMLSVAPALGVEDLVDVVNSIRSRGCADLPAVDQPLRARAQLDEAARRVARGDGLETATSESGYLGRKSASIRIRTNGDDGVAQILAQRFCRIVADKSFREIGVFRRGEETWMVLATPLSPPGQEDAAAAGQRVLDLINEARLHARRCGRKKFDATTRLRPAPALEQAARVHAQDMAAHHGFLGHQGSDKSTPADRATQAGYSWASVAENVAAGQATAEEVVNTWLASSGHCANLMNPRYSESGAARATNPDSEHVVYWVQVFAAPE